MNTTIARIIVGALVLVTLNNFSALSSFCHPIFLSVPPAFLREIGKLFWTALLPAEEFTMNSAIVNPLGLSRPSWVCYRRDASMMPYSPVSPDSDRSSRRPLGWSRH